MEEVDGNMSEGGGQILRISTSLSSLLQKPILVYDIRGGRKSPGLKYQHLNGIKLLAEMTSAELKGAELNSQKIEFSPKAHKSGTFKVDIGTAGSVTLLLQSALPAALFTSGLSQFFFSGGTNVDFSPPIDYNIDVLFPILKKFGIKVDCNIIKRSVDITTH